MDQVNFIHTEVGADIIISLSFDKGTEFGINGVMMMRTPKFEFILSPHERGACIHWDEETDIREIIKKMTSEGDTITIESNVRTYQFDLSKVSKSEIHAFWKTVDRINYDGSIHIDRT